MNERTEGDDAGGVVFPAQELSELVRHDPSALEAGGSLALSERRLLTGMFQIGRIVSYRLQSHFGQYRADGGGAQLPAAPRNSDFACLLPDPAIALAPKSDFAQMFVV